MLKKCYSFNDKSLKEVFTMTENIHSNANDYRDLCYYAGDILKGRNVDLPFGYRVIGKENDKRTNFKAVAYQKENDVILCFVGTDKFSMHDHITNVKMATSSEPTSQMKNANNFYRKFENKCPNIKVIGHSEGGSEALYVGLRNDLKTVTFNAYGLNKNLEKSIGNEHPEELVTNYRDPLDPVSKLRPLVGKTYIVKSNRTFADKINPFGMISAHKISNFGDCNNAQTVDEYKKKHSFIDNISEVEITDKDIAKMSTDLYELYDAEVSNRASKGEILKEQDAQNATIRGELIKVSAYIREDGIKVDGYYRRRPNYL